MPMHEYHPDTTNPATAVSVTGVSCSFLTAGQPLPVLADFDLEVSCGDFVSIIGPSGCGKSTLLRLLSGLLDDRADVDILGDAEVQGTSASEARSRYETGILFQHPTLLPWRTVLQNIELPRELMPHHNRPLRGAVELLSELGLEGFDAYYPGALSGGMQQRVALARALSWCPPILFLDEPFGALDAGTRESLNLQLLQLWTSQNLTMLFVTHSIPEAVFLSTRVIVLSSRPAQVILDLAIDLPRPRHLEVKETLAFVDLSRQVREALDSAVQPITAGQAK